MSALPVSTASSETRIRGLTLVSVIIALMLTLFLESLDQTIVGTAMPRIIAELRGLDRYTWVVTAYVLMATIAVPIVGKLSDLFGRKVFLLGGTTLFLLGSLLAGAAQTMDQFIAFRALQGLGAGMGMALVATVFGDLFPPDERAKWGGVFGLVYGVSNLCGPTLGGWLAEHGPLLGSLVTESGRWRWVFYINLPIGLLAVAALLLFLPANLSARTTEATGWAAVRRIDFPGALLSAAATICLMLGLTWGSTQMYAWSSLQVSGLLAVGAVLLILFLLAERKAGEPILPLDLFSNRAFSVVAVLCVLSIMVLMGLSLYLPLFLQGVLSASPTTAGLVMTALTVSMVIGAMSFGPLISATKRYRPFVILGALLMTAGIFLLTLMTPATSFWQAIMFMILAGVGTGTFFVVPVIAQNVMPQSQLGVVTASIRYMGQLGATLGIAIVGTAVTSSVSGELTQRLPVNQAEQLMFAQALQHGFVAVLIFGGITLLASFFLKEVPFVTVAHASAAETGDVALEESPVSTL